MKLMFYLDTKYIWLQSQFEYFDLFFFFDSITS